MTLKDKEFTDEELKKAHNRLVELRNEIMVIHSKYWQHSVTGEGFMISPFDLENNIIVELGRRVVNG